MRTGSCLLLGSLLCCSALAGDGLRQEVIRYVLEHPPAEGTGITVDFAGAPARARVISVNEQCVQVVMTGMEMPVPWEKFSDRRLLSLLLKSSGGEAERLELSARFALETGDVDQAKEIVAGLREKGIVVKGLDWGEPEAGKQPGRERPVRRPAAGTRPAAGALWAVGPEGKPSHPLPIGVGEWAYETRYWWPRDYHAFSYAKGSQTVWKKVLEHRARWDGKEQNPIETPSANPAPTTAEEAAGFLCWPVHYSDLCPPGRIPLGEARSARTLGARAALGEVEPVTIGIRAVKALKGFTAVPGDLRSESGAIISSEFVKVYYLEALYRTGRYADRAGGPHMRPGPLLELPSWDPPVNSTRRVWVNVHVPADAEPGRYQGSVLLKAQGHKPVAFDIELDVYPFVLENPKCIRWSPYISNFLTRKDSPGAVKDHLAHGMNTVSTWSGNFALGGTAAEPKVDISALAEYAEMLKQQGVIGPMLLYCSGSSLKLDPQVERAYGVRWPSEEFVTAFAKVTKNVHDQLEARRLPPLAFSLYDEETQTSRFWEGYKRVSAAIRERFPEVIVYATNHNTREAAALKNEAPDSADIWGTNRPNHDDYRFCREHGIQYWTYTFCNNHIHPTAARYNTGLLAWAYNGVATFLWANYWSDREQQYSGGGKWTLTYFTPEGVVSSVNWENVREGVDDRKYVSLAEYCAEECMRRGVAAGAARTALGWAVQAKRTIETLASTPSGGKDSFSVAVRNYGMLDKIRADAAAHIITLERALAGSR